jgi:hypothetical protein
VSRYKSMIFYIHKVQAKSYVFSNLKNEQWNDFFTAF